MTCMIAWPTLLVWLVWISLLFLFYFITSILNHISWLFGHEETTAIYLEGESTEFWKKGDFVFRGITHILFPWGNRLQKEKNNKGSGISFLDQRSYFLEGDFFIVFVEKHTRTGKGGDGSQDCPGTLLVTLGVLTHIWFLHLVVSELFNVLLIGVDGKGPQVVLLRLVACLFALFWFWFLYMLLMPAEICDFMPKFDQCSIYV